jgi:hypothetical protein
MPPAVSPDIGADEQNPHGFDHWCTRMKCEFTIHIGDKTETVRDADLARYADKIGLNRVANDRCSSVFVMDLLLHERFLGVEAWAIVEEIKALEEGRCGVGTKPASQFQHEPLCSLHLWKKHYFSARFVAHNIKNQLGRGKLTRLVNKIFDPQNPRIITEEMITELAHAATVEQIEQREDAGELTGEWIIFAKHEGQNYYLCLATHESGDQALFNRITSTCIPQFPFLSRKTEE